MRGSPHDRQFRIQTVIMADDLTGSLYRGGIMKNDRPQADEDEP